VVFLAKYMIWYVGYLLGHRGLDELDETATFGRAVIDNLEGAIAFVLLR
jgi:hypothetical protein